MESRVVLQLIYRYTMRRPMLLGISMIGSVVVVAFQIGIPFIVGEFFDKISRSVLPGNAQQVWLLLLGCFVGVAVANVVYQVSLNALMAATVSGLRTDMFNHLVRARSIKHDAGDTISRILDDAVDAHLLLTVVPLTLILNVTWLLVTLVVLMEVSTSFLLTVVVLLPLYLVLGHAIAVPIRKISEELVRDRSAIAHDLSEYVNTELLSRAYRLQHYWTGRLGGKIERFKQLRYSYGWWQAVASTGAHLVSDLLPALLLLQGINSLASGRMTLGILIASYGAAARVFSPLEALAGLVTQIASSQPALKRVHELLTAEQESGHGHGITVTNGHVQFHNITFGYEPDRPILRNFCAELMPGKINFIVGPNGSGKSTLLTLLLRFYEPTEGSISIDGQDVKGFNSDSVREHVAIVTQNTQLISGTLLDNVRLGQGDLDEVTIRTAAPRLGLSELIDALPDGWETRIGNGGIELSGGQAQRVALARALLRDTKILILDESTAHMDRDSERRTYELLAGPLSDKTVVIITHKRPEELSVPCQVIPMATQEQPSTGELTYV